MSGFNKSYYFVDASVTEPEGCDYFPQGIGVINIDSHELHTPHIQSYKNEIPKGFVYNQGIIAQVSEVRALEIALDLAEEEGKEAYIFSDSINNVEWLNGVPNPYIEKILRKTPFLRDGYNQARSKFDKLSDRIQVLWNQDHRIDDKIRHIIEEHMTMAHGASILASGSKGNNSNKGGIGALLGKPIERMWMPEGERFAEIHTAPRHALGLQWKELSTVEPADAPHDTLGL